MTLSTAGLQFYLGQPFLLSGRENKRQMIGKLIALLLWLSPVRSLVYANYEIIVLKHVEESPHLHSHFSSNLTFNVWALHFCEALVSFVGFFFSVLIYFF
jgi:hypothetical protein